MEPDSASPGLLRRRVAENVLRSDFTAIELARAMASRIQEILTAEPGTKRDEAERRVGSENGMSDRRVRQFVALLTLSLGAQELAQQARLSENSLRPIVSIKDPARQLVAVRELIHPAQEKVASRSPLRSSSQRKSISRSRRRSRNRANHARIPKSSSHRKPSAYGATRRKTRSGDEKSTTQTIQKVLILVSPLKVQDWARAMKEDPVRRALSTLYDSLEKALTRSVSNQGVKSSSVKR